MGFYLPEIVIPGPPLLRHRTCPFRCLGCGGRLVIRAYAEDTDVYDCERCGRRRQVIHARLASVGAGAMAGVGG